jgi:hypothetical protein
MRRFSLYHEEDASREGRWLFEPFEKGMNVRGPDKKVVCWFAHRDAENRFTLPSFWRSIKKIGFRLDNGSTIQFEPDKEAVAAVKEYLDEALTAQGMEALQKMSTKGWLNFLCGIGLLILGVAGIFVFREVLGIRDRKPYAFAVLLLLGIGQTAWGIHTVWRASKLKGRLWRSENP